MIAYGPVPSRRLGKSLGVNNIPPKKCSYSCIYCQLGETKDRQIKREEYYKTKRIKSDLRRKVEEVRSEGESIDYVSFVPDGEPTLDMNLEEEMSFSKSLGLRIAVLTNASLLWRDNVKKELSKSDWVSLKIDALTEKIWKKINRPHSSLKIGKILKGIKDFARSFEGELTTETMIVQEINDNRKEFKKIADFLSEVNPDTAYIAIPTRPPAKKWVDTPEEETINLAYQIFNEKLEKVEYLIEDEENDFVFTGNIRKNLLSVMSVHPMRKDSVEKFLTKADSNWNVIENLIEEEKIVPMEYRGKKFYMRKILEE